MKTEKIKRLFSKKGVRSVAVFTSLVLIALAVYLNYRWFYDPAGSIGFGDNNMDDNYQDSTATGGNGTELDYFAATALDRQESRDEALDVLKLVCESEESSEEAKAEATAKISQIAVDIQNENNIETLVKAKGFDECVAIISDGGRADG